MASTALPHTKNCRSEYRSGNSRFLLLAVTLSQHERAVIESPATMTSAATPASPVEGVPAEEAGAPDEAAGASEDVVGCLGRFRRRFGRLLSGLAVADRQLVDRVFRSRPWRTAKLR